MAQENLRRSADPDYCKRVPVVLFVTTSRPIGRRSSLSPADTQPLVRDRQHQGEFQPVHVRPLDIGWQRGPCQQAIRPRSASPLRICARPETRSAGAYMSAGAHSQGAPVRSARVTRTAEGLLDSGQLSRFLNPRGKCHASPCRNDLQSASCSRKRRVAGCARP